MSGIYINGMEMPTEGGTIVVYKINGQFFAARAGKNELFPLIHVPPHGRLIDADALDICEIYFDKYLEGVKDGLSEVAKLLADTPTIIPSSKQMKEDT